MLCLNCRYASPSGSAFCKHCGASLGVKLCPKRHVSPMDAEFCGVCGSSKLSKPARCIPLSGMSRLLTWLAVGVVGTALLGPIGSVIAHGTDYAMGSLFVWLARYAFLFLVIYGLTYLMPDYLGLPVRRGLAAVARLALWFVVATVKLVIDLGYSLVELIHDRYDRRNPTERR
jgi:hypothetical protein